MSKALSEAKMDVNQENLLTLGGDSLKEILVSMAQRDPLAEVFLRYNVILNRDPRDLPEYAYFHILNLLRDLIREDELDKKFTERNFFISSYYWLEELGQALYFFKRISDEFPEQSLKFYVMVLGLIHRYITYFVSDGKDNIKDTPGVAQVRGMWQKVVQEIGQCFNQITPEVDDLIKWLESKIIIPSEDINVILDVVCSREELGHYAESLVSRYKSVLTRELRENGKYISHCIHHDIEVDDYIHAIMRITRANDVVSSLDLVGESWKIIREQAMSRDDQDWGAHVKKVSDLAFELVESSALANTALQLLKAVGQPPLELAYIHWYRAYMMATISLSGRGMSGDDFVYRLDDISFNELASQCYTLSGDFICFFAYYYAISEVHDHDSIKIKGSEQFSDLCEHVFRNVPLSDALFYVGVLEPELVGQLFHRLLTQRISEIKSVSPLVMETLLDSDDLWGQEFQHAMVILSCAYNVLMSEAEEAISEEETISSEHKRERIDMRSRRLRDGIAETTVWNLAHQSVVGYDGLVEFIKNLDSSPGVDSVPSQISLPTVDDKKSSVITGIGNDGRIDGAVAHNVKTMNEPKKSPLQRIKSFLAPKL